MIYKRDGGREREREGERKEGGREGGREGGKEMMVDRLYIYNNKTFLIHTKIQ